MTTNKFAAGLEAATNFGYTENGGIKHVSTLNAVLDMFSLCGAYRNRSDEDCILAFQKALDEDETLALRCLFYLADARGGQGERRFFRVCYKWLAKKHTAAARRNMRQIPFYTRWDNLYCLVGTPLESEMFDFMKEQLALDMQSKTPSLLAKWLKSGNASSRETRELAERTRKAFGMTQRQYRKTLSILRERINVLERLMSAGKWDEIEFDSIPSKAGIKYKNAFTRHDVERMAAGKQTYADFAEDETKKVNADVLNPVDIANRIFTGQVKTETDRAIIDKYWSCLKDYYNGRKEHGIAICDVSGSMHGQPLNAAVSMSAYIAERGKGPFKDHFITFSSNPSLVRFKGVDTYDKFMRASNADWGGSTNVEAAMDLMLDVAIQNKVPASDMPTVLYIFSDMEFNCCMTCNSRSGYYDSHVSDPDTLFETIAKRWTAHGYELPRVVFWNLDARSQNIPAMGGRFSYVSGFSMNMVEAIFSGKDGVDLMLEKLNSDRYSAIH